MSGYNNRETHIVDLNGYLFRDLTLLNAASQIYVD